MEVVSLRGNPCTQHQSYAIMIKKAVPYSLALDPEDSTEHSDYKSCKQMCFSGLMQDLENERKKELTSKEVIKNISKVKISPKNEIPEKKIVPKPSYTNLAVKKAPVAANKNSFIMNANQHQRATPSKNSSIMVQDRSKSRSKSPINHSKVPLSTKHMSNSKINFVQKQPQKLPVAQPSAFKPTNFIKKKSQTNIVAQTERSVSRNNRAATAMSSA